MSEYTEKHPVLRWIGVGEEGALNAQMSSYQGIQFDEVERHPD